MAVPVVHAENLKSEIRAALIDTKSFACPIAARLAWHAAGTYDKRDGSGGTNGANMRYDPEMNDPANAGLSIVRDLLHVVKKKHPEISNADLWTLAGSLAIEFMGGPKVPHKLGRVDFPDASKCPAHGRLPDAAQGAEHIREVFYRMGFNDREIVALLGAHTVGRCHVARSGYDGPWTHNSLQFDNHYYKNLLHLTWKEKKWNGPLQYIDEETETLMMLPSDLALIKDPVFKQYVELYANDQDVFFKDFADAYAKLLALGCPAHCQPNYVGNPPTSLERGNALFRELAMHGSVDPMRNLAGKVDVHALEPATNRSALHKAAFWGHIDCIKYLVQECKLNVNVTDSHGDTALHDATRFGHVEVCKILLEGGTDISIKNADGFDILSLAKEYGKHDVIALIQKAKL